MNCNERRVHRTALQPCVPIVFHKRSIESIQKLGSNVIVEWKPDSSMLVVAVSVTGDLRRVFVRARTLLIVDFGRPLILLQFECEHGS